MARSWGVSKKSCLRPNYFVMAIFSTQFPPAGVAACHKVWYDTISIRKNKE